jgi:hypothetical protein
VTDEGLELTTCEIIPADTIIISIGDAVKLDLLTDAIGAGRVAARAISEILEGRAIERVKRKRFDWSRVRLA